MDAKSPFASKTLWINVLAALAAIVQVLQGQPWCSPDLQAALLAIINIALRFLTGQPIELPKTGGKAVLALALAGALFGSACSVYGPPGMSDETYGKLQSGAEYLDASLSAVSTALETAASTLPPEKQARLTDAREALLTAKAAASTFKANMSSPAQADNAWTVARAALSTAISVAGPILIQAMVR